MQEKVDIWKTTTVVATVIAAFTGLYNCSLNTKLARYEEARFNYVAEIVGDDLVVWNRGDPALHPEEVRVTPIFPSDTRLDNQGDGILVPYAEATHEEDGTRIFRNISMAVCSSPRYHEKCKVQPPSQIIVVFKLNGNRIQSAHAL